jgi:sulfatase maturation enzyme AslB (radical SAM superfamily)
LDDDVCIECPAITICGGGCAYDSYIANQGNFKKIDKRVCEYELNILDYLIWDLFENIKDKVGSKGIYFPSVEEQLEAFQRFYDAGNALQRSVGHENE